MKNQTVFSTVNLKPANHLIRVLSNKHNQKLLQLLHDNAELTVNQMVEKTGWHQALVSGRLALIRSVKLVVVEKQGRQRLYGLHLKNFKAAIAWATTPK